VLKAAVLSEYDVTFAPTVPITVSKPAGWVRRRRLTAKPSSLGVASSQTTSTRSSKVLGLDAFTFWGGIMVSAPPAPPSNANEDSTGTPPTRMTERTP